MNIYIYLYIYMCVCVCVNMSNFEKIKTNSYCFAGRQHSGTVNIYAFVAAKCNKMLKDSCSKSEKSKSMTVSEAPLEVE